MKGCISSAMIEKYLLKVLPLAIRFVKVALLSIMALGNPWFGFFSTKVMFIFPSKYLSDL